MGTPTPEALAGAATDLIRAYRETLIGHDDPEVQPFVDALGTVPPGGPLQAGPAPFSTAPAMAHLDRLIDTADTGSTLARAACSAARLVNWHPVFEGGGIAPDLTEGLMAAQAAGSYGVFASETVATGLFLLAPGLTYPLHNHAAREIYYVLSGRLTLQHGVDGQPFEVPAGQYSVTPEHRLHALATPDGPVLLAYAWSGQLICPNWWWDRDASGAWQRTEWRRFGAGSWQALRTEPVTDAIMAEAHGREPIAPASPPAAR